MPPYSWDDLKQGNTCSSIQFIGRPHGIERLSLKGCSIQFLSIGRVPKKLSTTYECLTYLEVDIELNSKEILATLCILRSSPNLKELKIEYCPDEVEGRYDLLAGGAEFWGAEAQPDCLLSHLRAVEIVGLALLVDLEFLRYILSNASVLETMKIYTCQFVEAKEVSRIMEELSRFRRASTAKIIHLGHYKRS
eukprot:TRINITY_DN4477_c0_g2_i2.p1 TRINITY_DN4477_c0_g2~~TRINITY_DN4477_c0_g2_i2.p1  ORF type:complete len:193 (+),score=22.73 TRINITY_DN4477_c0_g2_i2:588-1166(+)